MALDVDGRAAANALPKFAERIAGALPAPSAPPAMPWTQLRARARLEMAKMASSASCYQTAGTRYLNKHWEL